MPPAHFLRVFGSGSVGSLGIRAGAKFCRPDLKRDGAERSVGCAREHHFISGLKEMGNIRRERTARVRRDDGAVDADFRRTGDVFAHQPQQLGGVERARPAELPRVPRAGIGCGGLPGGTEANPMSGQWAVGSGH